MTWAVESTKTVQCMPAMTIGALFADLGAV